MVHAEGLARRLIERGAQEDDRSKATMSDDLARLFGGASAAVAHIDDDRRIVYANAAFCDIFSRHHHPLEGWSLADAVSGAFLGEIEPTVARGLGGSAVTVSGSFSTRSGRSTSLAGECYPDRDDHGAVRGAVLILHEIAVPEVEAIQHTSASEGSYQRVFDTALRTMNEGFAIYDSNERLIHCNDRYRSLFPAAAMLTVPGATYTELTREAVRGGDHRAIGIDQEARVRGIVDDYRRHAVVERELAAGRWIESRDYQSPDGGTVCIRIDITEHKLIEQALRGSEAKFKAVFENASVGICITEFDTRLRVANPTLEKMLGYGPDELVGLSWADLTHPDDLHESLAHTQLLRRGARSSFRIQKRYRHKNGGIVWVNVAGGLLRDSDGEPDAEICVIEDTTEKKQAEDRLREAHDRFELAAQATNDGLFDVDLTTGATWYSQRARDLFGFKERGDQTTLREWQSKVHPDDRAMIDRAFERVVADDEPYDVEYRLETEAGKWRWFHSIGLARRDETGRAIRLVGSNRDITERKEADETLMHAQKMETVGRLTGGVAHEFNNLLTAIGGFAHMIDAKAADPDLVRSFSKEIISASDQAAGLTSHLLAFSRKQVLDPSVVPAAEILDDMRNLVCRTLGERIELEMEIQDRDAHVKADRHQLAQALLNLAINARDAMPDTGRLTMGCRTCVLDRADLNRISDDANGLRPGNYCAFFVRDTGHGMDRRTMERIFEPFFTTKPTGSGTGLGLSMVYGMVRQSGGALGVDSAPDQGSTFTIYLPVQAPTGDTPEAAQQRDAAARAQGTILIVEDEVQVRNLATLVLEEEGYRVYAAEDGRAALELLQAKGDQIDLLVTDVVMPGMTGPELVRNLPKEAASIGIIFVSGYPERGTRSPEEHTIVESRAFLVKPFSPKQLRHAVGVAMRERLSE